MKMFNIGDKVSVLDDAIDGVVVSVNSNEVMVETTDGFLMTYFVNELVKINDSSSLDNSIKIINVNEIKKEKAIPKPRSFVKERKNKNEIQYVHLRLQFSVIEIRK